MELQPPGAPLPPFFASLRRRHPDVDIVVLADDAAPTDRLDDATVEAAVAEAGAAVAGLIDSEPETRLTYAGEVGAVRVRCRGVVEPADEGALGALRRRLTAEGWRVRRPERSPRLVARREGAVGLHLQASYSLSRGALLVEVATGPLPVGEERARALVRP